MQSRRAVRGPIFAILWTCPRLALLRAPSRGYHAFWTSSAGSSRSRGVRTVDCGLPCKAFPLIHRLRYGPVSDPIQTLCLHEWDIAMALAASPPDPPAELYIGGHRTAWRQADCADRGPFAVERGWTCRQRPRARLPAPCRLRRAAASGAGRAPATHPDQAGACCRYQGAAAREGNRAREAIPG